jgi:hypothetical protein
MNLMEYCKQKDEIESFAIYELLQKPLESTTER